VKLTGRFEVPRPGAEVWAELSGERPLHWCRILREVRWTSPRPLGAGRTRFVKALRGANDLREHYFRWEEGRQRSFYVVESTAPFARPGLPVTKRLLRTLFTDTRDYFGLG